MPFFSFVLKSNPSQVFKNDHVILNIKSFSQLQINKKYYSKDTQIWKLLNSKKYRIYIDEINFEKRDKISNIGEKILFFLPPSFGLGDAIEYALAIKAIMNNNICQSYGVAFVGKYEYIFKEIFNINNIYKDYISLDRLKFYDTIFHLTLEIEALKTQKYQRADIEKSILEYFNVNIKRIKKINKKKIKIITIFPISESPIRTMPFNILNEIVFFYSQNYKVKIIFDNKSQISKYIESLLGSFKNVIIIAPNNLKELNDEINNTEFGIFMDSGPLHLAKLNNIRGVLIESSVDSDILLNQFHSISVYKNYYNSKFCSNTCGLVNIFNYNNKVGCFDSLQVSKKIILNLSNLNHLQRGAIKQSYINFIDNPVKCLKKIDPKKLISYINQKIS